MKGLNMKYLKTSWLYMVVVALFLTGCSVPEGIGLHLGCEGGSNGLNRCDTWVTAELGSIGSDFDSGKLIIDTSQSTVSFSQNTLSATVVQKRNGVVINTLDVQFTRVGSDWIPNNTQSLNSWVSNNVGSDDVIEIGTAEMEFSSDPGMNVVVAELVYDNIVLAGASESWYVSPQGGGGQVMQ